MRDQIIRILQSQIQTSQIADDIAPHVVNAGAVADAILALSPSGAGAAEPVALADALEKSGWSNVSIGNKALIQNAIATLRATPPVRGNREAIERAIFEALLKARDDKVPWSWDDTLSIANRDLGIDTQIAKSQIAEVRQISAAILSLSVQPGAGERDPSLGLPKSQFAKYKTAAELDEENARQPPHSGDGEGR